MKNASVLVTAAGTVIAQGIMKCLKLANSEKKRHVKYRIVTADASPLAAGLYRGDAGILVPKASDADYIDSLISVCKKEKIEAVFIGADEEILPVAKSREEIESRTGAVVITNPERVVSVGLDKWQTFLLLEKHDLPRAESCLPEDRERFLREHPFPIAVKPREGHGSVNFHVATTKAEVDKAIRAIQRSGWRPVLQEYLQDEGQEFTTGVTVDAQGRHVLSSISMRRTLKAGQTYKAFVGDFTTIRESAEEAAIALGCRGPANVQARLERGEPKIFEINPRLSASCPIRAVAGVNEPDILFRNAVLGEEVLVNTYRSLVCLRYWNEVYIRNSTFETVRDEGGIDRPVSSVPRYF